jgi:hypothetical protein
MSPRADSNCCLNLFTSELFHRLTRASDFPLRRLLCNCSDEKVGAKSHERRSHFVR